MKKEVCRDFNFFLSKEYYPRTYKEEKKINFMDAIKSFFVIFYYLFSK